MGDSWHALNRILSTIDFVLGRIEAFALGWSILLMAGLTIANVIGRYVFNHSIYSAGEIEEFFMVLITFFGLGYVTRKGRHIRMTALYDQLPVGAKKTLMVLIAAVTGIVMFGLAWYSFRYIQKIAILGKVTPALRMPLYLSYIPVAVGFLVAGVQYLLTVVRNLDFSDRRVYASYTALDEYEDPELASVLHHDGPSERVDSSAEPLSKSGNGA